MPAGQQQGGQYGVPQWGGAPAQQQGAATDDERAVERYRYLLRTAPPERIEEVHAEAFAKLTDEQRRMVYDEFTRTAPPGEALRGDDPARSRSRRRGPRSANRASWSARSVASAVVAASVGSAADRRSAA
ncbi:hypothetical protein QP157_18950 [Sphingomonas sp. LR61]|uniref:hypothetical protein n=1 Tax=Sphingomonas sp. LR61 TaxID=3050234 RepID=UPI002FE2EA32